MPINAHYPCLLPFMSFCYCPTQPHHPPLFLFPLLFIFFPGQSCKLYKLKLTGRNWTIFRWSLLCCYSMRVKHPKRQIPGIGMKTLPIFSSSNSFYILFSHLHVPSTYNIVVTSSQYKSMKYHLYKFPIIGTHSFLPTTFSGSKKVLKPPSPKAAFFWEKRSHFFLSFLHTSSLK